MYHTRIDIKYPLVGHAHVAFDDVDEYVLESYDSLGTLLNEPLVRKCKLFQIDMFYQQPT